MVGLVELCRSLDKTEAQEDIELCVKIFIENRQQSYAKEGFLKLGDTRGLLQLYIKFDNWVKP